jgi:hypothetical protein
MRQVAKPNTTSTDWRMDEAARLKPMPELDRPRNGKQMNDALGIARCSKADGGGLVNKPFMSKAAPN